ncbi:MAG: DUF456 domain-containing protein [Balneolaceae bacterium]|nr:DUF456 domain-containing protein [Balneolaceae bacterium]
MELLWIILGGLLIITGIIGAFLPVMPGLPFSYLGLIVLQLVYAPFTVTFLVVWALIVAGVMLIDGVIPAWGTKKFGGSSYGVTGSIVGLILGIFLFPPLGFIWGPLVGAFIGELIAGNKSDKAFKSALGSFIGFMAATGIKVITAGTMAYYYFVNVV